MDANDKDLLDIIGEVKVQAAHHHTQALAKLRPNTLQWLSKTRHVGLLLSTLSDEEWNMFLMDYTRSASLQSRQKRAKVLPIDQSSSGEVLF